MSEPRCEVCGGTGRIRLSPGEGAACDACDGKITGAERTLLDLWREREGAKAPAKGRKP